MVGLTSFTDSSGPQLSRDKSHSCNVTIGANEKKNVFRKDEVKIFKDNGALLQNAPSEEQHMFKIPKVIN